MITALDWGKHGSGMGRDWAGYGMDRERSRNGKGLELDADEIRMGQVETARN